MYLFVYIFLLLSIMGLYSQLYMLQAASEKQYEVTAAQTMHSWHAAAHNLARLTGMKPTAGAPCSITSPGANVPCGYVLLDPATTVYPPGYPDYSLLPLGYNYNQKFESTVYELGGRGYLITYVRANRWILGFTSGELYSQIRRTNLPLSTYGQVVNEVCDGVVGAKAVFTNEYITPPSGVTYRLCYPVPSTLPDGSVAFISLL